MNVKPGDEVSMAETNRGHVDVVVLDVRVDGTVLVEHDRSQGPLPLKRWVTIPFFLSPRVTTA